MIPESVDAIAGLDRLATPDEIRLALESLVESDAEESGDTFLEIPSDNRGYVRILTEEFKFFDAIGEVTR